MNRDKICLKVERILSNMDIRRDEPDFLFLRDNAIAQRESGYSWKEVEATIEELLAQGSNVVDMFEWRRRA